ncbi:MAG: hypothetical protein ACREA0_03505 [bacterium]
MHAQLTSRSSVAGRSIAVLLMVASLLLTNVPPAHTRTGAPSASEGRPGLEPQPSRVFRGTVRASGTAVQGATVRLLQAGAAPGTAQLLLATTTDRYGQWQVQNDSGSDVPQIRNLQLNAKNEIYAAGL